MGEPFMERTVSICVNKHGCRYPSRHDYGVGTMVTLQMVGSFLPEIEFNKQQEVTRDAMVALLDKIGPAIVLVHSQAGPIGWAAGAVAAAIQALSVRWLPSDSRAWIAAATRRCWRSPILVPTSM